MGTALPALAEAQNGRQARMAACCHVHGMTGGVFGRCPVALARSRSPLWPGS